MTEPSTFVGLDVHQESIAVAVAAGDGGEVRSLGTIPNTPAAVAKAYLTENGLVSSG